MFAGGVQVMWKKCRASPSGSGRNWLKISIAGVWRHSQRAETYASVSSTFGISGVSWPRVVMISPWT
ncbi:hypothetical protein KBTX_04454 [wastewater metagenome]|uniref:Uncharacterized protein n=2 Tax=unclassified sequences TaxID=12908 RepID=A0A5B8RKA8_9ZZZZ|nr:hypothetical protein KBTEX_04454 [uncultured organism]